MRFSGLLQKIFLKALPALGHTNPFVFADVGLSMVNGVHIFNLFFDLEIALNRPSFWRPCTLISKELPMISKDLPIESLVIAREAFKQQIKARKIHYAYGWMNPFANMIFIQA